jgi:hypothetical protein
VRHFFMFHPSMLGHIDCWASLAFFQHVHDNFGVFGQSGQPIVETDATDLKSVFHNSRPNGPSNFWSSVYSASVSVYSVPVFGLRCFLPTPSCKAALGRLWIYPYPYTGYSYPSDFYISPIPKSDVYSPMETSYPMD